MCACMYLHAMMCVGTMSFSVQGTVAYVPQQAWMQNNTVKGNILFGRMMDGTYYDRTIRACALGPDLDILPGGDMAEIGEKVCTVCTVHVLAEPLSSFNPRVSISVEDRSSESALPVLSTKSLTSISSMILSVLWIHMWASTSLMRSLVQKAC